MSEYKQLDMFSCTEHVTPQNPWPKYWVPEQAFKINEHAAHFTDCYAPDLDPIDKQRRLLLAALCTLGADHPSS